MNTTPPVIGSGAPVVPGKLIGSPSNAGEALSAGTKFSYTQEVINELRGPNLRGIFRIEKGRAGQPAPPTRPGHYACLAYLTLI